MSARWANSLQRHDVVTATITYKPVARRQGSDRGVVEEGGRLAVLMAGVQSWAVVVESGRLTRVAVDRLLEFVIHGAGTGFIEIGNVVCGMKTRLDIRVHGARAELGDVHEQVGAGAEAEFAELGFAEEADAGSVG